MSRRGFNPLLYLILDVAQCGGYAKSLHVAEAAIRGGVTAIQLRAKRLSKSQLYGLANELSALTSAHDVPLIVNDHIDVAMTCGGVDGLHLGQEDLSLVTARRLLGESAIIGLSASNAEAVVDANRLPLGLIDYLGIGAVFASSTKPDSAPVGVKHFHQLCAQSHYPVVAIGGIEAGNLRQVMAGGEAKPAGIAVCGAICNAEDPERATRTLLETLSRLRDNK